MIQSVFPSAISTQSPSVEFLTIKTIVRKNHQNNGHTGSSCLDKPELGQGGGGYVRVCACVWLCNCVTCEMSWGNCVAKSGAKGT